MIEVPVIQDIVERAISTTEQAVLEVGDCLSRIVADSRENNESLKLIFERVDSGASNNGIGDALRSQEESTRGFLGVLERNVADHDADLHSMRGEVEEILTAGKSVRDILIGSRLLAINAQIEASRLGEQGKAFAVIAAEMGELSRSVAKINETIETLASRINHAMPKLEAASHALVESSSQFEVVFSERSESVNNAADALREFIASQLDQSRHRSERVLQTSQRALSNLQFQDPVAQSLRTIPAIVSGEKSEQSAGSDDVTAGEIMLF